MKDRTTLLSGLGEFEVVEVDRLAADAVRVVIETVAREAAYPECGTLSTRVKDLPLSRVKDLLGVRSAGRAVVAQAPPVVPTFLGVRGVRFWSGRWRSRKGRSTKGSMAMQPNAAGERRIHVAYGCS